MRDKTKGRRLFFISVLFMVLLNFPVLSIFNKGGTVGGMPVLYFYITLVWLVCIVAIGLLINHKSAGENRK